MEEEVDQGSVFGLSQGAREATPRHSPKPWPLWSHMNRESICRRAWWLSLMENSFEAFRIQVRCFIVQGLYSCLLFPLWWQKHGSSFSLVPIYRLHLDLVHSSLVGDNIRELLSSVSSTPWSSQSFTWLFKHTQLTLWKSTSETGQKKFLERNDFIPPCLALLLINAFCDSFCKSAVRDAFLWIKKGSDAREWR